MANAIGQALLLSVALDDTQARELLQHVVIPILVPNRDIMLDGDGRNQAIHGGADRAALAAAFPIDVRGREKKPQFQGVTETRQRQERRPKNLTISTTSEALRYLLNHRGGMLQI